MSDLFFVYEDNLKKFISKITNEKEEQDYSSAQNSVIEAEKIVKQMQIETSSITSRETIAQYKSIISKYVEKLSQLKKEIRIEIEKETTEKNNSLFDSKPNEKGGLIGNEEVAYSGSQKLEEARRVLAATEDTSNKIMSNMEEQTNKMKSVNVKIKGMNDNLDGSNSLLGNMQNRIEKNKKIILIFGLVLLGILLIIITGKILF